MRKWAALVIIVLHLSVTALPRVTGVRSGAENMPDGNGILRTGCGAAPILALAQGPLISRLRTVTVLANVAAKLAREPLPRREPLTSADPGLKCFLPGISFFLQHNSVFAPSRIPDLPPGAGLLCVLFILLLYRRRRCRGRHHAFSLARDDTDSSPSSMPRIRRMIPHGLSLTGAGFSLCGEGGHGA